MSIEGQVEEALSDDEFEAVMAEAQEARYGERGQGARPGEGSSRYRVQVVEQRSGWIEVRATSARDALNLVDAMLCEGPAVRRRLVERKLAREQIHVEHAEPVDAEEPQG